MGLFKKKKKRRLLVEDVSKTESPPLSKPIKNQEQAFMPHYLFKILLIGHNDSGNVTYLERFGNAWFEANTKLTIGISFEIKEIKIENFNIKLQIWDLAIEDRWKVMIPYYCRGALGAILMFETSNYETLHQLSRWVQIIRENTNNIPMILMGNVNYLDDIHQVSIDQGLDFVNSEGLDAYFECDVVSGKNLDTIFQKFTKMVIERYEQNH